MAILAEDKLREEALDKILLNKNAENKKGEALLATPFEVNYDVARIEKNKKASAKKEKKDSKVMVQIVENSELSARKYMFDPKKGICIGSKVGKNHIVITGSKVDAKQCEIVESAGKVYVHNIGNSGRIVLQRGNQKAYVQQKYVELKSGDCIILGDTIFEIDLVKTIEK